MLPTTALAPRPICSALAYTVIVELEEATKQSVRMQRLLSDLSFEIDTHINRGLKEAGIVTEARNQIQLAHGELTKDCDRSAAERVAKARQYFDAANTFVGRLRAGER